MSRLAGIETVGAVVSVALAFLCWNMAITEAVFAPVDGAPAFVSSRYDGTWIAVATVCVVVAGLLSIDAIRRYRFAASHTR